MAGQGGDVQNLQSWEVSDIDTTAIEAHNGSRLRQLGVSVKARDIFQMYEDSLVVGSPCIVVVSCVCPPSGH
eukprot:7230841-Pyramimonas_sp.AAC.1